MTDPLKPEEDADFQNAVVDVAAEMDSKRTLWGRLRDAGRTMGLRLLLVWRFLGGT